MITVGLVPEFILSIPSNVLGGVQLMQASKGPPPICVNGMRGFRHLRRSLLLRNIHPLEATTVPRRYYGTVRTRRRPPGSVYTWRRRKGPHFSGLVMLTVMCTLAMFMVSSHPLARGDQCGDLGPNRQPQRGGEASAPRRRKWKPG